MDYLIENIGIIVMGLGVACAYIWALMIAAMLWGLWAFPAGLFVTGAVIFAVCRIVRAIRTARYPLRLD